MPAVKFSPFGNSQFVNSVGAPASGWKLLTYQAGSSTPLAAYTTSAGDVAQSNPIILNALGFPTNGQIWLQTGISYKFVLTDASDVVQKTEDNISGVNDSVNSASEWVSGPTATYISASSFTVAGDQRQTFQVGRRLRFSVTAGTVYGTILTSVYNGSSLTTVTIAGGEGPLDAGLSSVAYGFLAPQNPSVPSIPLNLYAVRGLLGQNNAATPATKYDLSANAAVFYQPATGGTVSAGNISTVTNDVSLAGPVANGRDRAAVFSASNWIQFYLIWNGSSVASISSLVPPENGGPAMPPGYTHWVYCTTVFYNGSSVLLGTRTRGSYVGYTNEVIVLTSGTGASETTIVLSSAIPPNALTFEVNCQQAPTSNASGFVSVNSILRIVTGVNFGQFPYLGYNATPASTLGVGYSWHVSGIPNITQGLIYVLVNTTGTGALTITINGYKVPNGGE